MRAGAFPERVAFDAPLTTNDWSGAPAPGWADDLAAYKCAAQFVYSPVASNDEALDADKVVYQVVFGVRILHSAQARLITPAWRMRDLRRGTHFNIRQIDIITDRRVIYLRAQQYGV